MASSGSPVGVQWESMVIEPSVSWAEAKLVTLRHGMPMALHTARMVVLSKIR